MTHAQNEEIHFLEVLKKRTDKKGDLYPKGELIGDVYEGRMKSDRAYEIFELFKVKEYLDERDHSKNVGGKLYGISDAGRWYLDTLLNEKEKEDADLKVKNISYSSLKFNKYFPAIAAAIAVLAIVVPILIRVYWPPNDVVYKLSKEQVLILQQEQELNRQIIQQIHLDLNYLDTSINSLRKKR